MLDLAERKHNGARLVVTGCMAERYGDELAAALPEVDLVAGFGQELTATTAVALRSRRVPAFDLLNLPRPRSERPWAYVKIAEGCDRRCGFCAIPTFRGDQRSRSQAEILAESRALVAGGVKEIVLIAQDLASWGHDRRRAGRDEPVEALESGAAQPLVDLVDALAAEVERVRLLYLYPSGLTPRLIESILATRVPYFDLSLQHVTRPLLRAMRRWGDGERFLERIARYGVPSRRRRFAPRSSWATPARPRTTSPRCSSGSTRPSSTGRGSSRSRPRTARRRRRWTTRWTPRWPSNACARCSERQDAITARRRDAMVGTRQRVLVDAPGVARTVHECPEIDGIVRVDASMRVGELAECVVVASHGTDLEAVRA